MWCWGSKIKAYAYRNGDSLKRIIPFPVLESTGSCPTFMRNSQLKYSSTGSSEKSQALKLRWSFTCNDHSQMAKTSFSLGFKLYLQIYFLFIYIDMNIIKAIKSLKKISISLAIETDTERFGILNYYIV